MGLVKGYKIDFIFSPRRVWTAVPCTINQGAAASVKKAREDSLAVKGAVLFNLIPRGLRDVATDQQTSPLYQAARQQPCLTA